MADAYANIREILGEFIGRTLVDITQHDQEEYQEDGSCYVMLHFDNGGSVKFLVPEDGGFEAELDDPLPPPADPPST